VFHDTFSAKYIFSILIATHILYIDTSKNRYSTASEYNFHVQLRGLKSNPYCLFILMSSDENIFSVLV